MKKLRTLFAGHTAAVLYALGALGLVLWLLAQFAADSALYALGLLRPQTVTLADTGLYTLVDLEWDGADTLTALTGDVQLHLQPGQRVRTLRLVADYSTTLSYERDLYWHLPGMGYTPRLRIWPQAGPNGSWSYTLPVYAGQNLRLDLADQSGVEITIREIVLNERPALYTYFVPTLWQLLWLAAVPGLLACAIALGRDILARKPHTKKGGPKS